MNAAQMSVVVVTDQYRTIRRVLAGLRDQTVREQLEVIVVAPIGHDLELDETATDGFADFRVVELSSIHPMSVARAAGVRAASAPIVYIGETHSFPRPGLAAALIAAHAQPWDVVIPGLANANPESPLSWASFLMDYGQWFDELPAGDISGGPTWNAAYKRPVLLELGDRLDGALSHGDELAVALQAKGRAFYFEPAAKTDHANVSKRVWWVEQRYLAGLLVATSRAARWSLPKRLLYIFGSPLIPAKVLSRLGPPVKLLRRERRLPTGTLAALVIGAVVRTAGEVVGYVRGAGPGAQPRMDEYELHKLDFTSLPY
jgi:hypothetical protein